MTLVLAGCGPKTEPEELLFPSDREYTKWVGRSALPLIFTAIDGREVDLKKLRGRVVLLDFWATWCGPCMQKLPELKDIYTELHPKGLEIIGVSFDVERTALERVVQQQQIPWPQFFGGRDHEYGRRFGITHYPSMWLLDQDGVVRFISAGADLRGKVLKLMKQEPTKPFDVDKPRPKAFSHLKLKGVTGAGASALALINSGIRNHNFGLNEEHQIDTPSGIIRVKCVGITPKGADVLVDDYPSPLKLGLDDKVISVKPR